jgi:hypothetical protein
MKAWFVFVASCATILAAVNVAAQAPSRAAWLRSTEQSEGAEQGTYNLTLDWQVGVVDANHPRPTSFDIYRSLIGHDRALSEYDLVGTIDVASGAVNLSYVDEGVMRGGWFYYVKGRANGITGEASAVEMAFAPGAYCISSTDPVLNFVTAPKTIIEPGAAYTYGSWAQHRSARVQGWVRYQLVEGPDGMTIDELEGTVKWDAPATFHQPVHVKIRSWSLEDPSAEAFQEWGIRPAEPYEIQIGGATSVTEEARLASSVSPNPASSTVEISLMNAHGATEIRIVDVTGSVVYHSHASDALVRAYVDSLPVGAYVIVLQQGSGFQSIPLQIIR